MSGYWTDAAFNEAYRNDTPVKFTEETTIKAAVLRHTCTTCRGEIYPGQSYKRIVSMCIGDTAPWVTKEHLTGCFADR